jgi:4-amino-4-deoxy-L-arabinose transferase-like glycosyltransferase
MLFNPFLLGYQNTMLTEFSAIILWLIAITMLCSAFSSQQISVLCSVLFGLLLSLMYLLKQQYIIFPVTLLVLLVLCFRNIRLKQRLAFLIFSLIVFGVVTHSWNLFLDQHHAIKAERALSGVIFFQLTRVTPQATVLTSQSGSSCVEEVTLQPQAVPYRFDCTTGYELERTLPFIGTMYLENLWLILSSYFNNLLGIMAFSEIGVFSFEDYSIAMRTYNVGYSLSNIFHLSEQLWPYAQPYQVKEGANGYIVKLFLALAPLYRLFRLLVFVSVFMAMLVGLRRFKAYLSPAKEEQTLIEKFKVCTMFSLGMYVLIHGLITFPIDRYGFPVFIVAAVLLPTFPWQRSKPKQTPFKAG